MDKKISVILVDDFELSRVGLRYMLKNIPVIESVREAVDSKELFKLLKEEEPDIIFMDINLGDENGIEITEQILMKIPDTYIIAITSSKEIQHFSNMINAGASGFLLKNVTQNELEKAIMTILDGKMYYSKEFVSIAKQMLPKQPNRSKIKLSDREQEVLKQICLGYSNQEIADNLELSSHTIDAHRKKLLNKIGARNTASMIMISIKDGLIDLE